MSPAPPPCFFLRRSLAVAALALAAGPVAAETCPAAAPGWLSGRVVVFEPNLDPPRPRGVGEVFVYAYPPGETPADTRRMAVTDPDGFFCVHDTAPGAWVLTVYEPFTFRPRTVEVPCTASACDAGTLFVDDGLVRVSDDFTSPDVSDWTGSLAQGVTMPAGARSLVKVSFRAQGADGATSVTAYRGAPLDDAAGLAWLRIPANGGRSSAAFRPGAVEVAPGEVLTLVTGGAGWGPWRAASNPYPGGQLSIHDVGTGSLSPRPSEDLMFTLDVDGVDGQVTNHLVPGNDGWEFGSEFVQPFTARGRGVTHASVVTGTPSGFRRVQAWVSDANGTRVGPIKETIGLDQQGVAFAWFDGEVPTTIGATYALHVRLPEGGRAVYTRRADPGGRDPVPAHTLVVDGSPREGALSGRIMGPVADDTDAGALVFDAGALDVDAGALDVDAGAFDVDAGPFDVDAGPFDVDAGALLDAGAPGVDAGPFDVDAGALIDAGALVLDAGPQEPDPPEPAGGCGCRASSRHGGALLAALALGLLARRRRRR